MNILETVLSKQQFSQAQSREYEKKILASMNALEVSSTMPFGVRTAQGEMTFRLRIEPALRLKRDIIAGAEGMPVVVEVGFAWEQRIVLEMLMFVGVSTAAFQSGKVVHISGRASYFPLPLRWDIITDEAIRAGVLKGICETQGSKED